MARKKRETLRQKQSRFAKAIAELILWAYEQGYEVTYGDFYRDKRAFGEMGKRKAYGNSNSCHKIRLAADLNLFRNGRWLSSTRAHRFLGEKWESMGKDHSWGGHFSDGNHYSLAHNGKR